ncbi:MAG: 4Fe-4S dicluster domain-containing protein [Bacteroidales bacterium]|nr:4Fe-4S dicluster domain-containing protein [Bacteroidales bacterium]
MLKKIRIALAAIFFILITLLFVGIGQQWWGWMAKLQFLPAALALNFVVIIGICLLTLVFGRIYCSVICPMGVFQDIVSAIRGFFTGRKVKGSLLKQRNDFKFTKENKIVRYTVFALFVVALVAGVQVCVALIAPYSAYGRMVQTFVHPAGAPMLAVAIVTFLVVASLAVIGGRTYCNTICPVGTTLSFLSRFAIFRPMIDADVCKGCHMCEKGCKANCIDVDNKKIDYSRCVDCFNCIETCKFGGLKYRNAYAKKEAKPSSESVDASKRAFMVGTAMAGAATLKAQESLVDGGLAALEGKQIPERTNPLVPFGAKGVKDFYKHCTACQLCVSGCPNGVLRPSLDLEHFMQPVMQYEKGYCRPECTNCSQVCPAGAILPITPEEKTMMHIGVAEVNLDMCVVNRDGVSCGNCARHCPVGAIIMVPKDPSRPRGAQIPTVDEAKCIGCGACENLCPSRPLSAIHVNGLSVHITD